MPYLLPVTTVYLANLLSELKNCHSNRAYSFISNLSRGENNDKKREELTLFSDIIFYLQNFTVGEHDNKYLHYLKEQAMICDCIFLEEDLTANAIDLPILLENGGLILTEDGLYYLQQES
jgi:hypothetical protein